MTPETTPNGPASPRTSRSRPNNPLPIDDRPDPATTIVLADGHRLVRSALGDGARGRGRDGGCREAGDVGETLRKVRGHKPDVLVLDLNMPRGSVLDAIPRIVEASPGTAIVVLAIESTPQVAHAALRSGARAFVPKAAAHAELIDAVRAAANGHDYLNPQLGARIAAEPQPDSRPPDGLTERQLEVLRLLVSGYTNSEIADQLGIRERTVESHRAHIEQKTHRKSRADLIAYARDHGLVDP